MRKPSFAPWLPVAVSGAAVAVAARDHFVPVAAALVLCNIAIAVIGRGGIRAALSTLVMTIGFTVPMDSLRAGTIGGLADAVLLLALPLLVFARMTSDRPWPLGHFIPVMLSAAGVALGGLIGTFWSDQAGESLLNLLRFTIGIGGTLLLLAAVPRDIKDVRRYAWAFVLGATVSAAYGFTHFNIYHGRSSGLTVHPNTLGLVSALALSVVWGLLTTTGRISRLVAVACVGILTAGVFNSGSRSALLALVTSGITFLVFTRRTQLLRYGIPIFAMAALAITTGRYTLPTNNALDRLTDPRLSAESDEGRTALRDEAFRRIETNPLTGTGFASATAAHSVPIQLIDSAGALGALSGAAMVAMVIRPHVQRRRDPLLAAFLAMYLSYVAAALFSNAIWDRWIWFPVGCGLAAATHSGWRPLRTTQRPESMGAAPAATQIRSS